MHSKAIYDTKIDIHLNFVNILAKTTQYRKVKIIKIVQQSKEYVCYIILIFHSRSFSYEIKRFCVSYNSVFISLSNVRIVLMTGAIISISFVNNNCNKMYPLIKLKILKACIIICS